MEKLDATMQLLHLVFGGELENLDEIRFSDIAALDLVGVFPNYQTAYDAWKAKAQATVDKAGTRYFIVHLHQLLDPEASEPFARSSKIGRG